MLTTAFRGMHPFSQFIFTLFVMVVSAVIFFILSIIMAIPFMGITEILKSLTPSGMNSDEALNFVKYLQVVQSIAIFIIPPFILAYLFKGQISEYLMINRGPSISTYLFAAFTILLLIPLINFLGEINSHLQLPDFLIGLEEWIRNKEEEAKIMTEKFLKAEGIPGLLFNIFMVAMLPAIGEELLFRGVVQRIFTNWTKNYHWGIWIAAILFSAIHLQFYGFLPRMLLGAMFGYFLVWTGSIWVSMLAHFVNNVMGVIAFYLMDKHIISRDVEQWGTGSEQIPLLLFNLVSTDVVHYLIYRKHCKPQIP